jgi:thiosulfate/3-mercaptopyruvate sulfurtransferase
MGPPSFLFLPRLTLDYFLGMLIDSTTLLQNISRHDWVVFDCRHDLTDHTRGARLYGEGHLPAAFHVPVETVLSGEKNGVNGRHPLPVAAAFAEFLSRHGVTAETQIVAYDDVGGQYAARLWWLARWIGLTRVAVLDGGMPKWIAEGNLISTETPTPRPTGCVIPRPDATLVRSSADVLSGMARESCCVLDARAAERFRGEVEPIDRVAGHIPSAINRFFKANLNPDLTMRSPAELHREFTALLGQWRPEQVIHQCGSGVTACVNLLAMERAGLRGSRLYVGSWSEWIADPSRPIARG